jgi:methylmalonyl-CoA mutase cobalamin-binding domain/chain
MNTAEDISKFLDNYQKALEIGDGELASKVVGEALAAGILPTKIYLNVLMRSQKLVGELWHAGKLSIAAEHVATQITLQEASRLRTLLKSRIKLGLKAVVTTVAGDTHAIGARAVADFLVMDGWDVDFLGVDTPAEEIAKYAAVRGAKIVCVSMVMASYLEEMRRVVTLLKKLNPAPQVLVGGLAFTENPELFKTIGADGVAHDPQEAVTLARQLCGLLSTDNSLAIFLRKLGQSVHEYRKLRGLSQQELAESANLDRAYISSVEHGKQNISVGAIAKLAGALKISIEELLPINQPQIQ